MSELVRQFNENPAKATPLWRIASHKTAQIGDRVYLFKQGDAPRGIFGVGEIIEAPRDQIDITEVDQTPKPRVKIRFDRLVDPDQTFLVDFVTTQHIVPENLITAFASGNSVPVQAASELERCLAPLLTASLPISSDQADDPGFDPDSINDERGRALRAIRLRRGQPAFRTALLNAYGNRCVIINCAVEDVLEAAHITPYLGGLTNHVSNGLLLRTDFHTLFDCGLLGIEPTKRIVVVAQALTGSSYSKIAGKVLRPPKNLADGPSKRNLEKRFSIFEAAHRSPCAAKL